MYKRCKSLFYEREKKTMPEYAGCVYSKPPRRFGAQEVDDLSAHALSNMKLVGLPLLESHQKGCEVGKVTDQWQGPDGSTYVSFSVPDGLSTAVQREGLNSGFYGHLSLSHQVGNPPLPKGGFVCHVLLTLNIFTRLNLAFPCLTKRCPYATMAAARIV